MGLRLSIHTAFTQYSFIVPRGNSCLRRSVALPSAIMLARAARAHCVGRASATQVACPAHVAVERRRRNIARPKQTVSWPHSAGCRPQLAARAVPGAALPSTPTFDDQAELPTMPARGLRCDGGTRARHAHSHQHRHSHQRHTGVHSVPAPGAEAGRHGIAHYHLTRRAIVCGSGVAGLVTARVLSDHFDEVGSQRWPEHLQATQPPRCGARPAQPPAAAKNTSRMCNCRSTIQSLPLLLSTFVQVLLIERDTLPMEDFAPQQHGGAAGEKQRSLSAVVEAMSARRKGVPQYLQPHVSAWPITTPGLPAVLLCRHAHDII